MAGLAVSALVAIPLALLSHQLFASLLALVLGVPGAGSGMVVARRQPRNPIGWLFLVTAACLFLSTDGAGYAFLAYRLGRHLPLGALGLVLDQLWGPGLVLLFVVILLRSPRILSASTPTAGCPALTPRPGGTTSSRDPPSSSSSR